MLGVWLIRIFGVEWRVLYKVEVWSGCVGVGEAIDVMKCINKVGSPFAGTMSMLHRAFTIESRFVSGAYTSWCCWKVRGCLAEVKSSLFVACCRFFVAPFDTSFTKTAEGTNNFYSNRRSLKPSAPVEISL